jgi:hypothetical protein
MFILLCGMNEGGGRGSLESTILSIIPQSAQRDTAFSPLESSILPIRRKARFGM